MIKLFLLYFGLQSLGQLFNTLLVYGQLKAAAPWYLTLWLEQEEMNLILGDLGCK